MKRLYAFSILCLSCSAPKPREAEPSSNTTASAPRAPDSGAIAPATSGALLPAPAPPSAPKTALDTAALDTAALDAGAAPAADPLHPVHTDSEAFQAALQCARTQHHGVGTWGSRLKFTGAKPRHVKEGWVFDFGEEEPRGKPQGLSLLIETSGKCTTESME